MISSILQELKGKDNVIKEQQVSTVQLQSSLLEIEFNKKNLQEKVNQLNIELNETKSLIQDEKV